MSDANSPHRIVTSASTQKAVSMGGGVLAFQPPDRAAMHQSYMPFLKNGGIYIPTTKKYDIGSEVFVLVKLPDSGERLSGVGSVVWINRTPSVSKPSGIGIHFVESPENETLKLRIETFLAGSSHDAPTFTM